MRIRVQQGAELLQIGKMMTIVWRIHLPIAEYDPPPPRHPQNHPLRAVRETLKDAAILGRQERPSAKMLSVLRRFARSWAAGLLLVVLAIGLSLFSISDWLTVGRPDDIARVGKARISANDLSNSFDQVIELAGQRAGRQLTNAEALEQNLDQVALDRLVGAAAFEAEALALGMSPGDARLRAEIEAIPAFRSPLTGAFDLETYREQLRGASLTPREFQQDLGKDLLRQDVIGTYSALGAAPAGFIASFVRFITEERDVIWAGLPPTAAADPGQPSDEQLAALYETSKERLAEPERRAIALVAVGKDDYIDAVEVTDNDISRLYEARKSTLLTREKRSYVQVAFDSQAEALAVKTEATRLGALKAAAPQALNFPPLARTDIRDEALGNALFAAEPQAILGPIETNGSFFLAAVEAIEPPVQRSLEEAREELRRLLADDLAEEQLLDAVAALERALAENSDLEAAAESAELSILELPAFDASGRSDDGARVEFPFEGEAIVRAAFAATIGEVGEIINAEQGYWVLRVNESIPPRTPDLAEIRDQLIELWRGEQRAEALRALAETLKGRLASGENLEDVTKSYTGAVAPARETLSRGRQNPLIPPTLSALAFRTKEEEAGVEVLGNGAILLVRVEKIRSAEAALTPDDVTQISNNISSSIENDVLSALRDGILRDLTAKKRYWVNQDRARATLRPGETASP